MNRLKDKPIFKELKDKTYSLKELQSVCTDHNLHDFTLFAMMHNV